MFRNIWINFKKYSFLLKQLVNRDFKVKYKRSVLGILWSLLYPLLTMIVLTLIFTKVFEFSQPGVNYAVYLIIGLTYFNYFSEASNLSMSSVVANFPLLNKVYMPKYIFPLSKCIFVGINFLLSLIPLYGVILVTGSTAAGTKCHLNIYHLLLPYSFICLFMFTLGVGLLLACISVFLRDMFYIYGIMITMWMYFTPIMYDISMLGEKTQLILKLNPLYHFINFARMIILYNQVPSRSSFIACALFGFVFLVLGVVVFRRHQDQFIYYA
ncbi:MAG: ABC transporter permease [Lachnospiraceae bacterium]|nr:ABC transporter permease [Lachnospiraceae bacterium]